MDELKDYFSSAVQEHAGQLKTLAVCWAVAVGAGLGLYLLRKWAAGGVCRSQAKLDGKTVIITGANTGIGLETAVDLAKRNARVILACRSVERGETAAVEVRKRSGNDNVVFVQLDLASLDSVRKFSAKILEEEPRIDILVNNAGIWNPAYTESADGFELTFAVNHLGHFLLTNLLLDRIKEAPSARIVNVSGRAYENGTVEFDDLNTQRSYGMFKAFSRSKMASILFTRRLSKELRGSGVTVNALHPGAIYTDTFRQNLNLIVRVLLVPCRIFFKSPKQGAQTTIYCAVSEEMEGVTGQYLADCKIQRLKNPQATDDDQAADKLWEISTQLASLK